MKLLIYSSMLEIVFIHVCNKVTPGPLLPTDINYEQDMDKLLYPSFLGGRCNVITHPYLLMMTSSNGNIFRVTGPLCGEFTGPIEFPAQRPVTPSFDVFLDLNKRMSKQPWGWWFETPSLSLWRQCDVPLNLGHGWIIVVFYIHGITYPCVIVSHVFLRY